MRGPIAAALALSLFLALALAVALTSPGCATVVPTIPLEECDARCGTAEAEQLSLDVALAACDELTAAELSEHITPERCRLVAILANSCRTLCR